MRCILLVILNFGLTFSVLSQNCNLFQLKQGVNVLIYNNESDSSEVYLKFVFRNNDSVFIRGFFLKRIVITDSIIKEILDSNNRRIDLIFKRNKINYIDADPESGVIFKDKLEIEGYPYFIFLDSAKRDTIRTPFYSKIYYDYISKDNMVFGLRNSRFMHQEKYIYLNHFWFLSIQFEIEGVYNLSRINNNKIDLEKEFDWRRIRKSVYGY